MANSCSDKREYVNTTELEILQNVLVEGLPNNAVSVALDISDLYGIYQLCGSFSRMKTLKYCQFKTFLFFA